MKKITAICMVFILILGMVGCAQSAPAETGQIQTESTKITGKPDTQNIEGEIDKKGESKVLIAYFSQTGNTKILTDMIADCSNSNVFRIEPIVSYPGHIRGYA